MPGGRASRQKASAGSVRSSASYKNAALLLNAFHCRVLQVGRSGGERCAAMDFRELYKWFDGADLLIVRTDRSYPLVIMPLTPCRRDRKGGRTGEGNQQMNLNEILRGYAAAQLKFLQQQELEPVDTGETAKQRSVIDMTNENKKSESGLPARSSNSDFECGDRDADRTIQGSIIKCIDGRWVDRDDREFPAGTKMLALGTTEVLQHFHGGTLIDEIKEKPFPDLDELNNAIPQEEWDDVINGPRPPWSHQYVCYLLDPTDAALYTSINNTVGQEIAVRRLAEKVSWMRQLRGAHVRPMVVLDHRPMPTRHGAVKQRPEWTVVDWVDLSGGGSSVEHKPTPQLPPSQAAAPIGKPVEPVTTAEEFSDSISF
jgi:hypothetical protein